MINLSNLCQRTNTHENAQYIQAVNRDILVLLEEFKVKTVGALLNAIDPANDDHTPALEKLEKIFAGLEDFENSGNIPETAKEKIWNRDRYIKWAKDQVDENEDWVEKTFKFNSDGTVEVAGHLNLIDKINLTELPPGLQVGRDLSLKNCTSLKELPPDLQVSGNLWLRNCPSLKELPPGLQVGRHLSLTNCTSLTKLPPDLQVGGNLSLNNCTSLTDLPDDLVVGGNIYLAGTTDEVKAKARWLKAEGKITGEIYE